MKIDYIFILPYSFFGPTLTPGHKKDVFKLVDKLRERNKIVSIMYSDNKHVYDSSLQKTFIKLKQIFSGEIYGESSVIIGPTHCFRLTLFMRKNRIIYYYVYDSILKTSLFAFLNDIKLIHRVFYAYLIEFLLRKHRIIVSSLEEYTWFSSSGHKIENIYLMTSVPDIVISQKLHRKQKLENRVLIYNPSSDGISIAISIIKELISRNVNVQIIVTGAATSIIRDVIPASERLTLIPFVENISELISECSIGIITDVFGSGFCNRAVQIRTLGIPLLSTLPGLRGTGLILDPDVQIFYSPAQAVEILVDRISNGNFIESESWVAKSLLFCADREVDHLIA